MGETLDVFIVGQETKQNKQVFKYIKLVVGCSWVELTSIGLENALTAARLCALRACGCCKYANDCVPSNRWGSCELVDT